MPTVEVAAPGRSNFPGCRSDSLTNNGVIQARIRPIGTLTNSTQRQLAHWVSMPPASRPMAAPEPETAAKTPKARLRSSPSAKLVVIRASAVGEAKAPPTPWSARKASSEPEFQAKPPASEATENSRMPAMKVRRRPMMSPMRPPSSSRPPKVSV
jgi:hypothetical protein